MVGRLIPRLLLLALLFSPLEVFPQQQILGKILGTIRIDRGEFPTRQIMVALFLRGAPVETTYADGQGVFGFSNLVPNGYHIVISDEGFYPVDEPANVNPDFSAITTLHIVLRTREDTKPHDPAGQKPSGGNPFLVDLADYNKHFPKQALKLYEKGLEAEHKANVDEAIARYQGAIKIAPDYYPAHNNLGSLYLREKDFKSAEREFLDAARLDQNDAQAFLNLGNLFMLTGRYAESSQAIFSALQRRPDSAFGHFLQGSLSSRSGNYSGAEKDLKEALRLDPTMWQAQLQLVNTYLQQHESQNAISQLQTFLQAFPSVPAVPKAKELLQKLQNESRGTPPAN